MGKVAIALLVASRLLGALAIAAGILGGLIAAIGAAVICMGACPSQEDTFTILSADALHSMWPCVALELLAMACFLAYCAVTRQRDRALRATLLLVVVGVVGAGALTALLMYMQETMPSIVYALSVEGLLGLWPWWWGLSLIVVACVWTDLAMIPYFRRTDTASKQPTLGALRAERAAPTEA